MSYVVLPIEKLTPHLVYYPYYTSIPNPIHSNKTEEVGDEESNKKAKVDDE